MFREAFMYVYVAYISVDSHACSVHCVPSILYIVLHDCMAVCSVYYSCFTCRYVCIVYCPSLLSAAMLMNDKHFCLLAFMHAEWIHFQCLSAC